MRLRPHARHRDELPEVRANLVLEALAAHAEQLDERVAHLERRLAERISKEDDRSFGVPSRPGLIDLSAPTAKPVDVVGEARGWAASA